LQSHRPRRTLYGLVANTRSGHRRMPDNSLSF
jgi:hypothetical protein